ncbi:heavy metal translocating P-type ATPase [Scopulibacillus darangshiensis]|uniref:heavy metal translocating P-type ATPase n=1 Tax=Scopulibacillus darangshiensis TaxID=442528 RepID=UPI003C778AA7
MISLADIGLSHHMAKPQKPLFQNVKKHGELTAALVAGLLILIGWAISHILPQTPWYLFLLAYLIGGYAKAKEGIEETVRHRDLNVELLMILAAIGAAAINHWLEGAVLIFIFALSGALETYSMAKSSNAISSLMDLRPETARRITNDKEQVIDVERLNIGDVIRIKPGERIPADGIILNGETSVDESAMTGESMPILKSVNASVLAGTVNIDGSLKVKVTKTSNDSLFSKILILVQNAQSEKAPSQVFIEKFEGKYVKTVLTVVALMIILPPFLFSWTWSETIYRAMVLLVVASPCALVASTMPAVLSAIAFGARQGILVKGGVHLEQLAGIKSIAFDKTGTLTKGKPEVASFINNSSLTDSTLLSHIAAIEHDATHPLSEAIIAYAKQKSIGDWPLASNVKTKPGFGVSGRIDNVNYKIGKIGFVDEAAANSFLNKQGIKMESHTFVFIENTEGVIGCLLLKDQIRAMTNKAVDALHHFGIKTIILTGDNEETAQVIAAESGVSRTVANCLPENKATEIKQLKREYGSVAMIGDGINDTPALAEATVGIAMGGGTDAALETADIVLVKNDLVKIADTVRLSRKMNKIVKQNIIFAMGMILLLIASNFLQVLSLPVGVIGHEGSTILVILNGLRLLRG